ncbi:M48 family metalloprotease [Spirosoma sordidisoli]|uniref:Uncharacterized protein n=1 Tax=Spirosoma sordidisoli TaxID=2502893 RepID=A0A4Q2UV12_9BACT|nr:hypothetical protein [Spirosoma sordidisoli]RYC71660.1 hypothetical protein EQG79_05880 [Spirosoma sordidisoli]
MKTTKLFLFSLLLVSCNNQPSKTNNETTQNQMHTEHTIIQVTEPTESINGKIDGFSGGCGYNKTPEQNSITLYQPRPRELSQINSILKFSGLASNFKIFSANIENAIATIVNNERYILYDPRLLAYTDQQSGDYWSSMSILAHEIGHHLAGHTISKKGSNPSDELEADKFSGFVLYKLGATLAQAKAAMETLGSETESLTHPAKQRRLAAIEKGWNEANETRYNSAIPPPPPDIDDFTGGMSEFNTENLLDEESYSALKSRNGNGSWVSDKCEGIITEVDEKNTTYEIYITKNGGSDESGLRVHDKVWVSLYDPWEAKQAVGRAGLSWLHAILVPGRRIRFAYGEEGTAPSRYFAYIKYLPAQ